MDIIRNCDILLNSQRFAAHTNVALCCENADHANYKTLGNPAQFTADALRTVSPTMARRPPIKNRKRALIHKECNCAFPLADRHALPGDPTRRIVWCRPKQTGL
jgi:hypothetical protein